MLRLAALVSLSLTLVSPSFAALYNSLAELPTNKTYDFVVVGGGTGGSVVATRLTENSNTSVLVLEAGPSNRGILNATVPFYGFYITTGTEIDWNYTTTAQPGFGGRSVISRAGHVLGGSSSVNGMIWVRGSVADWNHLANVSGDPGWGWDNIYTYYKKLEQYTPPSTGKDVSGEYDPSVHGTSGPLGISMPGVTEDTDARVINTTKEFPDEFPFVLDYNNPDTPIGMGWVQNTIRDGTRASAAYAYLTDSVLARSNLDVVVNTRVTKLTGSTNGTIDTAQVTNADGSVTSLKASKEIILSAGTISDTRILLNSGIGPASQIQNLKGVELVKDIPDVGQNLADHMIMPIIWRVNSTNTIDYYAQHPEAAQAALEQWQTNKTGRFASGEPFQAGFFRLNESDPEVQSMIQKYGDPATGPDSPHIEMVALNGNPSGVSAAGGYYFALACVNLVPYSRGNVTLNPSDPLGQPLVNPNYYDHPMDIFIVSQCMRMAIKFASGSAFKGYLEDNYVGLEGVIDSNGNINEDALYANARNITVAGDHQIATNIISPKGASTGVVDPDLKVKGINGLRIVDLSIFPHTPASHTESIVYAISERASDLIKQEYA
ncbi:alcohol oxidase [Gloeophyllum trabeum ATCC 11539]|uniref:Alcohol oxidase n=1 Tax=Gloeophyllum trabeum (strain ATCC 11539 / FP-39264 / Madison 617) TaxID=670483 RepID=S7PSB6_GLOTA|nr:alcohol oxidase [Gloeophyllum trabeum ATCC 11539]EPQ50282.1 alcohol oxidase [Gloeophyllum trabeum ATCC 11539]